VLVFLGTSRLEQGRLAARDAAAARASAQAQMPHLEIVSAGSGAKAKADEVLQLSQSLC